MTMKDKNKKVVDDFGGVEALVELFGAQSSLAPVIRCIDALQPIPKEIMLAAKADFPAIQWYFIYAGAAELSLLHDEGEKWSALAGILEDYRLMLARRERVPA